MGVCCDISYGTKSEFYAKLIGEHYPVIYEMKIENLTKVYRNIDIRIWNKAYLSNGR